MKVMMSLVQLKDRKKNSKLKKEKGRREWRKRRLVILALSLKSAL